MAAAYQRHRAAVIGLAYRMTGSLATAEDIAQEVFLRWHDADRAAIALPRAWMLKAAARLSIDHLKSARMRRERYVGAWLPEPLLDAPLGAGEAMRAPQEAARLAAEDLSVAFLLTLQRLSPAERAVFILHDLFETPFTEIAGLLGRSEAACRKLAGRARAHLGTVEPRQAVSEAEARRIATAFLAASRSGDEAGLRRLLAEDAVLRSDGGGLRYAALNPIRGAERVIRLFAGLARKGSPGLPPLLHLGHINGWPGYVTLEPDGLPQVTTLELREGRIAGIYVLRNPEKLAALRVRQPA
ncbi:sigma-70 family RNA polymerase sigma factor [Roseicella sp. DB1501]|uniref:sigma-70 family RNA polymerase sigma factor n=1 Tax=Roseicella sp. DB1501 TaxID=2730925 RepID=UPI0020C48927|nr:sigma-70 family RNA polymerase sigma factor [Roseicella sp. DB1501]